MKRIISVFVSICLLFCISAACAHEEDKPLCAVMRISVNSTHGSYNDVGTDWSTYYEVNGNRLNGAAVVLLTEGTSLSLYARFRENDKKPDIGSYTETLPVDRELLENGKTVSFKVDVYENGGRYSGNRCTWTAVFTIECIDTENGIPVKVTADTVAFADGSGKTVYLKKGESFFITGYSASEDRFNASYNGITGLVKGIGLEYEKEDLKSVFSASSEADNSGIYVKVTADTVALTTESGKTVYIKKGGSFTVTGYFPETDRFTAVYDGSTGTVKGIGLNYSKEQLKSMLGR